MEVSSFYRSFVVLPPVLTAPQTAIADSVETLLPQGSQSVAPVAAGSPSASADDPAANGGQAGSGDIPGQPATVGRFSRDAATNTLVFMEVDVQTQAVIVQFPDEQRLKLRSYLAEMQRREEATQQSVPGSHITKSM